MRASLERANSYAHPTVKLESVPSAYWTQMGEKEHLRWVMPHDEETLLNALARLHAAGEDSLGEGTRFVGHVPHAGPRLPGLGPAARHGRGSDRGSRPQRSVTRLDAALADTSPLTSEQRRARAGLTTRQVTLR